MSSNIEVRLIRLEKKIVFTLRDIPAKLKDLVVTFGSNPEKAKDTFMMYWNGYLRFYCEPSNYHVGTLQGMSKSDMDGDVHNEKQVIYIDLDGMDIDSIRKSTSLYDASRRMNCTTNFALKGKRFVITITPLDESCAQALTYIDHSPS